MVVIPLTIVEEEFLISSLLTNTTTRKDIFLKPILVDENPPFYVLIHTHKEFSYLFLANKFYN